nr:reverse transcriptase domain-containing protein [Tanacetum cinerariifolium]
LSLNRYWILGVDQRDRRSLLSENSFISDGAKRYGARATSATPGIRSIWNFTGRAGGRPGKFLENSLGMSWMIVLWAKLPHPTTFKGVRSFLGHAGFYRRFIQDFSKIARPMTHLLEKETPFVFSKECIDAFNTLKKKLTEASILVVPDWNLPFKLTCDASDYAIGAVLGQRKSKHFQPIHYASKMIIEAQIHYTTTEKEMLAIVYAFESFGHTLFCPKA